MDEINEERGVSMLLWRRANLETAGCITGPHNLEQRKRELIPQVSSHFIAY